MAEDENQTDTVVTMRGVAVASQRAPKEVVLRDVDWEVRRGELWVVAGPQRSGKSDLLMLAGGLTPPVDGAYHFLGERMPIFEEERLEHRLKVSYVFDGGQLFGRMTIADNVALPLRYHENLSRTEAEARVSELLGLLELTPLAHQMPASVARNWQKRAGLARALILKPSLLLVDNPLGGLDVRHATWWLNFLEQLIEGHSFMGGQPITVIVTTDDLPRLVGGLRRAARYAIVNQGRLRTVGSRETMPASVDPELKSLLAEIDWPQVD